VRFEQLLAPAAWRSLIADIDGYQLRRHSAAARR
jgi:hypothetical protein